MKALSLRQPWADLIFQGQKTLELRSWKTAYRGRLAIHASQSVDKVACRAHGMDPARVSAGVIIGTVELLEIIPLDEQSFAARQSEHHAAGEFTSPLYGWEIANPQALEKPVPYPGRMSLFNVPDDIMGGAVGEAATGPASQGRPAGEGTLDSRLPFELQVHAEAGASPALAAYRLALYQQPVLPPAAQQSFIQVAPPQRRLVCEIGGVALKAVADAVLEALRLNGYAATDLSSKRRAPFHLAEESGVRLALIFLAVRPITKVTRIEAISRGIRAMTGEELYYWFSKCAGTGSAERAQKALRLLLSEE